MTDFDASTFQWAPLVPELCVEDIGRRRAGKTIRQRPEPTDRRVLDSAHLGAPRRRQLASLHPTRRALVSNRLRRERPTPVPGPRPRRLLVALRRRTGRAPRGAVAQSLAGAS